MKKMKLLPLVLILVCAGLFAGYNAWDRINTDKNAPEITVGTETIQASVSAPRSTLLQDITATDDRDGDVTDSMVVESIRALDSKGTVEVTFAAFDQAGNVAKGTRTVCYTDYQPPRFSLDAPLIYAFGTSFDPLATIQAADVLDGDLNARIRAMSMDDNSVSTLGDHQVEFRVTNSLGDTTRLTLPVTIYDSETHILTVNLSRYMIYLKRGSHFDAEQYFASVNSHLETYAAADLPSEYSLRITGDVNANVPGVYPVDYTVTRAQKTSTGTQYTSGFSRLIVIVEG